MTKHFKPPWSGDVGRYPAVALEKHSALCRIIDVPDATHPLDLRDMIADLDTEDRRAAMVAAQNAAERLDQICAWGPKFDNPIEPMRDALRNPNHEHICLLGGRGGGKSHEIADAIVEIGSTEKHRVVCAREFMVSIADSSKALLQDKIDKSRWANQWRSTDYLLENVVTGTTITFLGVARNPQSAKSMEGATIFWGEEACTFSQKSIDIILPTIRKGGSRFFWSYNPDQPDDPIDVMFRKGEAPERSYVRLVQCTDNQFFYSDTRMASERRTAFIKSSATKFRHVWFGGYDTNPDGLVYQDVTIGRVSLPDDASPMYAVDWGWTDPLSAVEVFVIEPDDPETEKGTIYIRAEVHGSGIPAKSIATEIDSAMPFARTHTIIADSSEPKSIADLQQQGFHVIPAKKGAGSIRAGITFIQGYKIVISPDCVGTIADFTSYMWKKSKDGRILRDPVDLDNHAPDALRYALERYTPPARTQRSGGVVWVKRR